jgi:hypothetical protein
VAGGARWLCPCSGGRGRRSALRAGEECLAACIYKRRGTTGISNFEMAGSLAAGEGKGSVITLTCGSTKTLSSGTPMFSFIVLNMLCLYSINFAKEEYTIGIIHFCFLVEKHDEVFFLKKEKVKHDEVLVKGICMFSFDMRFTCRIQISKIFFQYVTSNK